MPATSGRVRMPHNNRVSTSHALKTSDIWSKTIGHDPYANQSEDAAANSNAEKARGLLELARHQNLTGGRSGGGDAGGDDFARKMFLGLKAGKKRSGAVNQNGGVGSLDADARALLEEESSSSEEEFVKTGDAASLGGKPKVDAEVECSSSEDSSDESREMRRRRKRKEKKRSRSSSRRRKKRDKKYRKRSSKRRDHSDSESESSESDSSSDDRRKKRRRYRERKDRHHDGKKRDKYYDGRDRKEKGHNGGGDKDVGKSRHRDHDDQRERDG